MRKITQNFRGHYKELILGPFFKLLEAVLELFVPMVMAGIIDIGVVQKNQNYIITRGLLVLLIGVVGMGFALICQYYAAVVAGKFGQSLRKQTYRHVLTLSEGDVSVFGAGGLITRLTNDINQLQNGVNMTVRLATRAPFLAVGSIIMAMRINLRVGLVFLAATVIIVLILYIIMRRTLPSYGNIQGEQDKLSRLTTENLAGTRVIRAFSRQYQEIEDYKGTSDKLTNLTVKVGKVAGALTPLTTIATNLAIVAIVWLGAWLVFDGHMLSGRVIALVNYMNQTFLALVVAANFVVLFTRALASARRINEVLEAQPRVQAPETPLATWNQNAPAIAFENVSFSYHKGAQNTLDDITFTIAPGQTVGIIGGTGSGKTTIANLIMRYFDIKSGTISLGGALLTDRDPGQLRGHIGLVPQSPRLFAGSVRDNMLMSAPCATDPDIWHALETAQADEFVKAMPGQLDSRIEEGGKNLSGGQRQRLTIARALVRKPRILILDDSASALDYATDAALSKALAAQNRERPTTVIMISQRAISIKHADIILVLDDGRLAGQGTHAQLIGENRVYQEICQSQGLFSIGVDA